MPDDKKLPWHVGASNVTVWGDAGRVKIADHIRHDQAEFIVMACNGHAALLAACAASAKVIEELMVEVCRNADHDVSLMAGAELVRRQLNVVLAGGKP